MIRKRPSHAPAYDVGFSKGAFNCNAMSVNGKFVNPTVRDFRMVAEEFRIKDWKEILAKTIDTVMQYPVVEVVPENYGTRSAQ